MESTQASRDLSQEVTKKLAKKMTEDILKSLDASDHPLECMIEMYLAKQLSNFKNVVELNVIAAYQG